MRPFLAASTLGIGFLLAGGCATNPVTGKSQVVLVSESQEVAQGIEAYPVATQVSEGATPHAGIQSLVREVGLKIARNSERPNLPWDYNVVDSNEPNAYALPGGKISITRGLIARLNSEDQLAAVLGHETGHVTARHSVVAQSRETLLGALLGAGGAVLEARGTPGVGAISAAGQLGAALLTARYSRDQERQADELGMRYMTAAGYNPRASVEVMQILAEASGGEPSKFQTLFASHPLTSERLETAQQRLASGDTQAQSRKMTAAAFARAVAPLKAEAPAFALADEGKKLAQNNQTAAAGEKFERAVRMVPSSPILNVLWADTLYDMRQYARADEAAGHAPELYFGRLIQGASRWEMGRYRESLQELEAADRLVPDTVLVAYFKGRDLETLGDRRAAAEQYVKVAQATQGQGTYGGYALARLREWGYVQ